MNHNNNQNTFNYSINSFKQINNQNHNHVHNQEGQNNTENIENIENIDNIDNIQRLFHTKFTKYKIKKHIGSQDNYNLFLINCKDVKSPRTKNKKYVTNSVCNKSKKKHRKPGNKPSKFILKVITINDDNKNIVDETTHQQHIIKYLKKNPSTRPFINNCYESKQINNNLFLILQYFDSLSLKEVSPYLLKLNSKNYVTFVQYLVKQILKGLKNIHHKNIPHCSLDFNNIIISHKLNKDVYIKFINFKTPRHIIKKIKNQKRDVLSIKSGNSSKLNKLKGEDISNCGHLLIDLITIRYKDDLQKIKAKNDEQKKERKSSKTGFSLDNIMANIFKKHKTVDDIIPKKLLFYIKTIKEMMVDSQETPKSVIRELLFKEKYQ
jgi:serine/threonine protein kinase